MKFLIKIWEEREKRIWGGAHHYLPPLPVKPLRPPCCPVDAVFTHHCVSERGERKKENKKGETHLTSLAVPVKAAFPLCTHSCVSHDIIHLHACSCVHPTFAHLHVAA